MKALRNYVDWLIEKKGVHPRLILNVDHVFTFLYRERNKKMHKDPEKAGEEKETLRVGGRLLRVSRLLADCRLPCLPVLHMWLLEN
jgi:hypothetical protein